MVSYSMVLFLSMTNIFQYIYLSLKLRVAPENQWLEDEFGKAS